MATLAFAIYLIQKPLDHITSSFLSEYNIITKNNPVMFVCTASVFILSGWLLYTLIETPFLKLRNIHYKVAKI